MAVLGVTPKMFIIHKALNTVSQFWFHTETISRLPFGLEYVLNTASHHRLHHHYPGNCNYGGFLIIFDRMFGTFEAETKFHQNYGLAEQAQTCDPVAMNVSVIKKMLRIPKSNIFKQFFTRRAKHDW